jgi:hypothetical protein
MILHRNKRSQTIRNSIILHRMELPSIARRHSDVASVACFDDVVESVHRFGDGSFGIETVALENVDVVELKARE